MSYSYYVIETFRATGESSHNSIRARPLPGQGLPENMRVECSSSMRKKYPIGTTIKIWAQIKHTGSEPHLYTNYNWEYEVLSDEEARQFIGNQKNA